VCIPNAVKMPLLRRKKANSPSDPASRLCSESNKSNNTFLPLTVTPNAYDQGQKLQLLRHAKQTLEYIDLSTSSTIIHVNQIMVQATKSDVNSQHLLDLISCLDNGLRMPYFNKESWNENSLTRALIALKNYVNLRQLWNTMNRNMHITDVNNELASNLLFIFVKNSQKGDVSLI